MIEGIEAPDRRFVLGVQWHPESFWDRREGSRPSSRPCGAGEGRGDHERRALARGRRRRTPPASASSPDFDEALKKARSQNKPLMVDFWAEWCGWCHRLDKTTYVDPRS